MQNKFLKCLLALMINEQNNVFSAGRGEKGNKNKKCF